MGFINQLITGGPHLVPILFMGGSKPTYKWGAPPCRTQWWILQLASLDDIWIWWSLRSSLTTHIWKPIPPAPYFFWSPRNREIDPWWIIGFSRGSSLWLMGFINQLIHEGPHGPTLWLINVWIGLRRWAAFNSQLGIVMAQKRGMPFFTNQYFMEWGILIRGTIEAWYYHYSGST